MWFLGIPLTKSSSKGLKTTNVVKYCLFWEISYNSLDHLYIKMQFYQCQSTLEAVGGECKQFVREKEISRLSNEESARLCADFFSAVRAEMFFYFKVLFKEHQGKLPQVQSCYSRSCHFSFPSLLTLLCEIS